MAARSTPPLARIASAIHQVRGHRVMLDADLAALYGVTTKRLNEQGPGTAAVSPKTSCSS
jgi:hypothetical protein